MQYIPYFQTTRYRVQTMIELADIKPHELAADLGSGDGRILIELAKAGAIAHGYELDEKLIKQSEENIRKVFSQNDKVSTIKDKEESSLSVQNENIPIILQKDFWQEDLSKYSIITIYGMPDIMKELEKKLKTELKAGSRVLSNYYLFPTLQNAVKKDNVYLYTI